MWIDYNVMQHCTEPLVVKAFVPSECSVVLGRANKSASECFEERCRADGVPIYRRAGGGGTVLLHAGCVVVSVGAWVTDYYSNKKYFGLLNDALIATLSEKWPIFSRIQPRGLSDLAFGERKVCGSSLFRSRNYLLFQASLLVDSRIELIERYLTHPSREPDYRLGKAHRDFIGSLSTFGCEIDVAAVLKLMQGEVLLRHLKQRFSTELILPPKKQVADVLKRIVGPQSLWRKNSEESGVASASINVRPSLSSQTQLP